MNSINGDSTQGAGHTGVTKRNNLLCSLKLVASEACARCGPYGNVRTILWREELK